MNFRAYLRLAAALGSVASCISPALAASIVHPDASVMKFDEIGLYSVGYTYRGRQTKRFPEGWSGFFEEKTGVACLPAGVQNGKQAFLLHCPWKNGTGTAFQEYAFAIPKVKRVVLRGATAMRSDITDKSDGATFRIYANGRKLLDVHRTDSNWLPYEFDLSSCSGKQLWIRFETDPGPKDNPSYDYALWGDRELAIDGLKTVPLPAPAPKRLDLAKLWSAQNGDVAPLTGFDAKTSVRLANDRAILRSEGSDGAMEYWWDRPKSAGDPPLGRLKLYTRMTSVPSFEIPLATTADLKWTAPAQFKSSHWERSGADTVTCYQDYDIGGKSVTIKTVGKLSGKSLVLEITCDQPCLSGIDAGGWGPVVRRRPVVVPYYSGQVSYLPVEGLFVNSFLDWTYSAGTNHAGAMSWYGQLTDGSRNCLKERAIYSPSWHLAEVLPNIPNPKSPFIRSIGNRVVLDTWGGPYKEIARNLEKLSDYGITNCVVLVHDWQRSGYDNALPAHIPAAANLGGDEGMEFLVSTAKRLGYIIALHENYVDYYPNYDNYDEKDIALDSEGKKQLAWYNPGTKIQSFAVKPNSVLPLARTQSPEIHSRYGTNGDYLDVHSAVPPWFHIDMRAGEEGAGMFSRTWDVHRRLWQYERDTHGGPVFGEGANHWYWSGCLDGVEAQFGVGWPGNKGMDAPLAVDFDLLRIHPLQFNHGMGYYERWWENPQWGAKPPMVVLDQYRMQEVAYGHAGFLGGATWSDVPLVWLEHHLLSPVMERYSGAKPAEISYEIDGKWLDGTAAAKAGIRQRVRVRYDNGLTVYANSSDSVMKSESHDLARFGWLAEGAGITAGTTLRDGVVTDYAETADSVFANARNAGFWNDSGIRRIRPRVEEFEQTGPRTIRFAYGWQSKESPSEDLISFVHFSSPPGDQAGEHIVFQQDHAPSKPATTWSRTEENVDGPYTLTLADDVPDGAYDWMIGLLSPGSGQRQSMEGVDDGHQRIRLGSLLVHDGGKSISFEVEKRTGDERLKLYSSDLNDSEKVIDFGTVRTNGSILVRREGGDWVLRTLPRDVKFAVGFSSTRFPVPSEIRCTGGTSPAATVTPNGNWWGLELNGAGQYRWKAE